MTNEQTFLLLQSWKARIEHAVSLAEDSMPDDAERVLEYRHIEKDCQGGQNSPIMCYNSSHYADVPGDHFKALEPLSALLEELDESMEVLKGARQ